MKKRMHAYDHGSDIEELLVATPVSDEEPILFSPHSMHWAVGVCISKDLIIGDRFGWELQGHIGHQ